MISLNQKETALLQDQKKHEELCIKKYSSYSNQASDPQLKQLLTTQGQQEQHHLNSINQLLAGQLPAMGGQQGGQQAGMQSQQNQQAFPPIQPGNASAQADAIMCEDLLSTEKYVSSIYNTAIFEFRDPGVRQVLNHIQKEEQEHGLGLYSYMASHGMYQA
jgi:spore coat protein CotF